MADSDLIDLYSGRILELASTIPHIGQLAAPDARVKRRSPQCGSSVSVDIKVVDGRVAEFAQDVKACALGQAAASLVGAQIVGRTRGEIEAGRDQLRAMLIDGAPPPAAPFTGFEVLTPAREFKNRHASILLAFDASAEAMAEVEAAA